MIADGAALSWLVLTPYKPVFPRPLVSGKHVLLFYVCGTGLEVSPGGLLQDFIIEREVSHQLLEAGVFLGLDIQTALYGHPQPKWDRKRAPNPMYTSYKCKDRWCMMCHPTQEFWSPFCKAIGKPELINAPRYNTMENREQHAEELVALLDEIMAAKTWAEWEKEFKANDLITSGNQTIAEILDDEQAILNNFFTDIEHPIIGKARLLNSPVQFTDTPAQISSVAPQLGVHTEEVLLEAGYTWEDLEEMKQQKAIL